MATTEQEAVAELALIFIEKMRAGKFGVYHAMRILGYVTVAVAEAVDFDGDDTSFA